MLEAKLLKVISLSAIGFLLLGYPQGSSQSATFEKNINSLSDAKKTEIVLVASSQTNSQKQTTLKKATGSGGGIGKVGPVLSKTKIINGKLVCRKANDHPAKSKKNPKGHIDGECCLDPDEIPNSLCYYPPEKYGKLIQKYLSRK